MTSGSARPPRARVLVVDDHLAFAETVADGLEERGYDAVACASGREALAMLDGDGVDALVTDLRMPEVDGFALLAASRKSDPTRPVIVVTAYGAIDSAIESVRRGAHHYLTKPFQLEELALFLARTLDEARVRRDADGLRRALRERYSRANLVFRSAAMQDVVDLIDRVAASSATVLVTGETGTGKGLVAAAIHAESPREAGPFVKLNCAAIPEALLESELFGHAKGAFTGATTARAGLFQAASGGTLFLDEIAELPPALQAKLLHVLEARTVRPVGANAEVPVDARIVAATHRDLRERVAAGAFREDLLYRLDVVTIEVPPLRLRRDDLPALLERFLAAARARHPASTVRQLDPDVVRRLLDHAWPGNVRELEHLVERLVVLGRGEVVTAGELPARIGAAVAAEPTSFAGEVVPMRDMQRRYARWALDAMAGKKLATAEKLGIDIKTLGKLLGARDDGGV